MLLANNEAESGELADLDWGPGAYEEPLEVLTSRGTAHWLREGRVRRAPASPKSWRGRFPLVPKQKMPGKWQSTDLDDLRAVA
jgi:hypothetical protein